MRILTQVYELPMREPITSLAQMQVNDLVTNNRLIIRFLLQYWKERKIIG